MASFTIRARGPRSPQEAWERYARPALWSTWSPQIRRVEVDTERLSAGITGRVLGPMGVSADFTVASFDDRGRRWTWSVTPRPLGPNIQMTHGVDSRGDGSETWLELTGPLLVVLGYAPVARLALHRLVH